MTIDTSDSGLVLDPVCGMTIDPSDAAGQYDYDGKTYYFCNPHCLEQFRADPRRFLEPAALPSAGDATAEYTCPMDPEVRQIGPGACPKCGMALEPVTVATLRQTEWTCPMHPDVVRQEAGSCPICGMTLEPRVVTLEEQNPELDDMTRRLRLSVVLVAPILAFMVGDVLP